MNLSFNLSGKFNLVSNTLYFFRKHFVVVMGLGLFAAFGRVIQLGGFGQVSQWINILLEIAIESARLLLFLYVLGLANVKNGILKITSLFTRRHNLKVLLTTACRNLKMQWLSVFLNIIGFLLIAYTINYLIDLVAYETCLYLTLKKDGILVESSSEWTILLFFKNLTVIPFTLIFDTFLVLWLSNKLNNYRRIYPAQK